MERSIAGDVNRTFTYSPSTYWQVSTSSRIQGVIIYIRDTFEDSNEPRQTQLGTYKNIFDRRFIYYVIHDCVLGRYMEIEIDGNRNSSFSLSYRLSSILVIKFDSTEIVRFLLYVIILDVEDELDTRPDAISSFNYLDTPSCIGTNQSVYRPNLVAVRHHRFGGGGDR